jgi:hypothetical protein
MPGERVARRHKQKPRLAAGGSAFQPGMARRYRVADRSMTAGGRRACIGTERRLGQPQERDDR